MYENKQIRPKFHFLTKIEIKMTYLVFFFCFLLGCLFASKTIWKLFYRRLQFGVVRTVRELLVQLKIVIASYLY